MMFPRATKIELRKSFPRLLPFSKLLVAFLQVRFNGAACRRIAESTIREGADENSFRLDEFERSFEHPSLRSRNRRASSMRYGR